MFYNIHLVKKIHKIFTGYVVWPFFSYFDFVVYCKFSSVWKFIHLVWSLLFLPSRFLAGRRTQQRAPPPLDHHLEEPPTWRSSLRPPNREEQRILLLPAYRTQTQAAFWRQSCCRLLPHVHRYAAAVLQYTAVHWTALQFTARHFSG